MGLCCEMLNLVVLGQILWFRFRCWFSVMKIGRGNPSLIKKNYYLHSGLLPPSYFGSKFVHEFYL